MNAALLASEHARPGRKQRGAGAVLASISHNAALERIAAAALARLKAPASLARDWQQMLAYRRKLIDELGALAKDVKAGEQRAVQALALSKLQVHQKLLQLASRDGFKDCAHVGSDPSTLSRPQTQPQPQRPPAGGRRTRASRARSLSASRAAPGARAKA